LRPLYNLMAGLWLGLLSLAPSALAEGSSPRAPLVIQDPEGQLIAALQVEIAASPAQQRQGLMGRTLPDDNLGMLFIFPEARPRHFWMHDTPGSLDMIFADDGGRITHIVHAAPPLSDRIHSSQGLARYVLEVRGGFAARHGVLPGMWLILTDGKPGAWGPSAP